MKLGLAYIISFGVTLLAAWAGSAASIRAAPFYASLTKPSWAPQATVFGPVWTILYLMMAIAGGLALRDAKNVGILATLFIIQLALNALWSWTFFRWESGIGSIITIVALWIAIIATAVTFWRANSISGALMLPCLGWVTFAALLNIVLWRLNPGSL